MNKLIEEKLVTEYPGLVRTIQLIGNNTIEIEFNFQYSNEIGIRFWKSYDNVNVENENLKEYYSSGGKFEDEVSEEVARQSWIKLVEDTIENRVSLPNNGIGYEYKGNKDVLPETLNYIKSKWL